jgi:hypothetical protein
MEAIEFPVAGFLGAVGGTILAAMVYLAGAVVVLPRLHARIAAMEGSQRQRYEARFCLMRQAVLAADIALLGSIGFWLGERYCG